MIPLFSNAFGKELQAPRCLAAHNRTLTRCSSVAPCADSKPQAVACQVRKIVCFLLAEQQLTEFQRNITIRSVTLEFLHDSSHSITEARFLPFLFCFLLQTNRQSHYNIPVYRYHLKALGCLKHYCNTRGAWLSIKITICFFQFSNKISMKIPNEFTSFNYCCWPSPTVCFWKVFLGLADWTL